MFERSIWDCLHLSTWLRSRIDCTNAAATSRIQSRVFGIDMLQAKKMERLSAIL